LLQDLVFAEKVEVPQSRGDDDKIIIFIAFISENVGHASESFDAADGVFCHDPQTGNHSVFSLLRLCK
jgi:hypothetical protein